jgi:hypothetical protein
MTVDFRELDRLRGQLADLVDMHPPEDWSPALLRAVNGVLELHLAELGFGSPAPVLALVRSSMADD